MNTKKKYTFFEQDLKNGIISRGEYNKFTNEFVDKVNKRDQSPFGDSYLGCCVWDMVSWGLMENDYGRSFLNISEGIEEATDKDWELLERIIIHDGLVKKDPITDPDYANLWI